MLSACGDDKEPTVLDGSRVSSARNERMNAPEPVHLLESRKTAQQSAAKEIAGKILAVGASRDRQKAIGEQAESAQQAQIEKVDMRVPEDLQGKNVSFEKRSRANSRGCGGRPGVFQSARKRIPRKNRQRAGRF